MFKILKNLVTISLLGSKKKKEKEKEKIQNQSFRGVSKKEFLKIFENSEENICAGVSF